MYNILPSFIAVAFSLSLVDSSAAEGWEFEQINWTSAAYPSLAFDSSGKPAIAYFHDKKWIGYARYDGVSWTIADLPCGGEYVSLAFDPFDNPGIASATGCDGGGLAYVHFNGTSWDRTIFQDALQPYSVYGASLDFDSFGNPGIAYLVYVGVMGRYELRYSNFNGSAWSTTVVDTPGDFAAGRSNPVSLAMDVSGNPSISYIRKVWTTQVRFYYYLKYAHSNGTSWDITTVDADWNLFDTSLAIDPVSGNPAIAIGTYGVRYATFNGTSWSVEAIDTGPGPVRTLSLAFDPSGRAAIAFHSFNSYGAYACFDGCLGYARFNGTSWDTGSVQQPGGPVPSRGDESLAFDVFGNPGMTYGGYGLAYVHFVPDSSPNDPPTADAGSDRTVPVASVVTLDGSVSADPDGDVPLSYNWSLVSKPAGSAAVLANPDAVNPTFTPDLPGIYAAQLIVTDSLGARSTPDTVEVTGVENHPPTLHAVGNTTVGYGTTLSFAVSATDPDGDDLTYSASNLPAGATFTASTHTFSWTPTHTQIGVYGGVQFAVNDGHAAVTADITITVRDATPPVLTLPDPMTAEATGPSGVVMSFSATATDQISGSVPVTCSPASGATFPLGTTTVTCTASDGAANTATGSFAVTVRDTTPPALTLPSPIADATGPEGAAVSFQTTGSDLVDGAVIPICTATSGAIFAIGDTTVECTAADSARNEARLSFTVHVNGAPEQLAALLAVVAGLGPGQSLAAKVQAAQAAIGRGDTASACGSLNALANEAWAQWGKKLLERQASSIITTADRVRAVLGCR